VEKLLIQYYNIKPDQKIRKYDDYFFVDEKSIYSVMPFHEENTSYHEQSLLIEACIYHGYDYFLRIIPNHFGELVTEYDGEKFMVSHGKLRIRKTDQGPGVTLAKFHQSNYSYPYEPQNMSSYGHWRTLWIQNLSFFEKEFTKEKPAFTGEFYRKGRDILPYIIGLSENALQYLQENEDERGFTDYDRGTITFHRYQGQIEESFIPFGELIYDHPIRDLSEYIRKALINKEDGVDHSLRFLIEYNRYLPISLYGWKLLYARLLFPIHFFDLFGQEMTEGKDYSLHLENLIEKQCNYEQGFVQLFAEIERNYQPLSMHMIQWLYNS